MQPAVIFLKHLTKKFGKQLILKDVNFEVPQGQIVGLIGPSGSGKSTVIKTTLGMEIAEGGEATVFNQKMPNRQLLAKIGYMAQSDALYETLTARENLMFFGQMRGLSKQQLKAEIEHVSTVVDLNQYLNQPVQGYSGGMKRRLSLAIALLGEPQLLVLDEPTVGIDPALRRKIWQELQLIRDAGRSILITTHVMDEAELVDQVALLLEGEVMAFDTPTKLKQRYQVDTIEAVFLKAEGE